MQPFSEAEYYARHFRLPGFDAAVQARLRAARVLVVGVGGLGCPAALYLAGLGVGHLCLCDGDRVAASNLHRQVLFEAAQVGQPKADVAAARLRAMNPNIQVEAVPRHADADWLVGAAGRFDLVLDGTDNFAAKFLINDACAAAGVPLVYGSIFQFEGQVSVFHLCGADGAPGYSYRDLFPQGPPPPLAQNCGEAGVVGVLPGVIGTLQATEAFKVLSGLGEVLSGVLLTYDALTATTRRLRLSRRSERVGVVSEVPTLPWADVLARNADGRPPMLLDVREAAERQRASLGGLHIPLSELPACLDQLPHRGELVVYCQSGLRSARAVLYLQTVLSGVELYNLEGGCDAALGPGIVCA